MKKWFTFHLDPQPRAEYDLPLDAIHPQESQCSASRQIKKEGSYGHICFQNITNDIDQPDHPVNDPEIINIFDVDSDEDDEENWWPPVKICFKL